MIQSILFNLKKWDIPSAVKWLDKHELKHEKVDITENYLRFRQFDPKGGKFYTQSLKNGIKLIIER